MEELGAHSKLKVELELAVRRKWSGAALK